MFSMFIHKKSITFSMCKYMGILSHYLHHQFQDMRFLLPQHQHMLFLHLQLRCQDQQILTYLRHQESLLGPKKTWINNLSQVSSYSAVNVMLFLTPVRTKLTDEESFIRNSSN